MKPKLISWSIIISFILGAVVVFADPMDDFIAQLTEYKNEIERSYKKVALSRSLYDLNRYFSFAAIDHKAVTKGLIDQAQNDYLRMQNIKAEFEGLKIELANHPEKINELAARFFSLMSEARGLQNRSQIIEKDIDQIVESWRHYCNDDRIQLAQKRFDPLANFTPDGNLGFVSGPAVPISVEVQMGFNSNGEMTDFRTQVNDEMNERKEKEAAATTAAAAGVSYFCGPWAPLCFAAVFALKSLIDIGRMGEKLADIAKKEQKQNELRRQIYDIQYNSIVDISSQTATEAVKVCNNNFTLKTEWPTELIGEYRKQIEQISVEMSEYVSVDLVGAKKESYDFLINQYFPEVSKKYLSVIRDYFSDQNILKSQIIEFVQKPIETDLNRWKISDSVIKKTLRAHEVWDDVILADSLFREDDNFSFYEQTTITNSFPNLWHDLGPKILLEVAK